MYAILGDIKFQGYFGFNEFTYTDEAVLSQHPVIEGKPRLQKTGMKLRELNFKMTLHVSFCNPEREANRLVGYASDGTILPLLSGSGTNYGNFAVLSIATSLTQTDNDGNLVSVELDVSLIESVIPGERKKPASEKLAVKVPNLGVVPLVPKPTDPQKMAAALKTVNVQSSAMDKELKDAERIPSKQDRAFRKAQERIDKIRNSMAVVEDVASNTRDIITLADSVRGQADSVRGQTEALAIFVKDRDIHSAVQSSSELRNAYARLNIDAAPINNLVAIRRDKESPLVEGGTKFNFKFNGRF